MLTGELMYSAHVASTQDFLGRILPPWELLGWQIRDAWDQRAYEQELRDRDNLVDHLREEQVV